MLELLALLLPVAAASGWYVARRHYLATFNPPSAPLPPSYFRDLNYLLNERAAKAIDVVEEFLEQNPEAIETQIALGILFRKQGEVEKAIALHEKLLENPHLQEYQRNDAYHELGMDYMKAGLLDRAESIFKALTTTTHRTQALHQLLQIFQQEKDWSGAMNCALELKRLSGTMPRGESESQFLAELAEEAHANGDIHLARDYIARAIKTDPGSIRATLIQAEFDIRDEYYVDTLPRLIRISLEQTEYFPVILPLIKTCYKNLQDSSGYRSYLNQIYFRCGLIDAAIALSEEINAVEGSEAAVKYLLQVLNHRPSIKALDVLLNLLAQTGFPVKSEIVMELGCIMKVLHADGIRYVCEQCGFEGAILHWRCPSCQHWSTTKPAK